MNFENGFIHNDLEKMKLDSIQEQLKVRLFNNIKWKLIGNFYITLYLKKKSLIKNTNVNFHTYIKILIKILF